MYSPYAALAETLRVEVIGYSNPNSKPTFLLFIPVTVSATNELLSFAIVVGSSTPAPSPKRRKFLFGFEF